MDNQEPIESILPPEPKITWVDRVQAVFEIVLVSGALSSILAVLPFAFRPGASEKLLTDVPLMVRYVLLEAFLTILFLVLILKAHREKLGDLGFFPHRWTSEAAIGVAVVPVLFLTNVVVSFIFQHFFQRYFLERNPLTDLIRTPRDLALFVGMALIAGGIKEELQRAFILRRFQACLGGAWLGLILWSVLFGFGHYVQGAQGIVAASIFGLVFGILYLARGNLIAPMVAHGLYDTLALLGYWFFVPHK
jgi:membrane protease YdiL (CAAX protease family)